MGWATNYIDKLKNGETVQFRPRGDSMKGKINSGDLVTVEPVDPKDIKKGDIVLCKVGRSQYIHIVKAVGEDGRFQIGNNQGHINGWTSTARIYGKCTKVER